jgi:hypothetical protein
MHSTRSSYSLLSNQHNSSCLKRVAVCIVNIFITPFLLLVRSIQIYLLPCISVSLNNCWQSFVISCLIKRLNLFSSGEWTYISSIYFNSNQRCSFAIIFIEYFLFTDTEFPPSSKSLGSNSMVKWVRLQDMQFTTADGVSCPINCLFDREIHPNDICQGALGDCWLLAAFATLSERDAYIQNCFITRVFNPFGRYKIKLFDTRANKFVHIIIDDYIPCNSSGTLLLKLSIIQNF